MKERLKKVEKSCKRSLKKIEKVEKKFRQNLEKSWDFFISEVVKKVGMEAGKIEIVLSPSLIPDPEAKTVKSSKADSIGKPSIPCFPSGGIQTCWTTNFDTIVCIQFYYVNCELLHQNC